MTAMGVCVGFGDEQSSLGPFKSTVLSTAKMELGEARGDFPLCTTRLSGMPVAHNFEQAVASSKVTIKYIFYKLYDYFILYR